MPNHVKHFVTIKGNKEDIAKVSAQIIDAYVDNEGELHEFSFNTIIPRPSELDITVGSRSEEALKFVNGTEEEKASIKEKYVNDEKTISDLVKLGNQIKSNIAKYGFGDWYEWSIANWGTKWDAYDVFTECCDDVITLEFLTAWNVCEPVFEKLSEQYSDLTIIIEYADENLGENCGTCEICGGECIAHEIGDYQFACSLWGIDDEEDEEEEDDEEEVE